MSGGWVFNTNSKFALFTVLNPQLGDWSPTAKMNSFIKPAIGPHSPPRTTQSLGFGSGIINKRTGALAGRRNEQNHHFARLKHWFRFAYLAI